MDQNKSTISLSISNSRPISPSPVTESAVAAPATVEEGINCSKRTRGWPRIYGRDARGKFLSKSGTQTKRSLTNSRGDMSMTLGGDMSMTLGRGDFTPHIFTINKGEDIIKRIMSFTEYGSRGINVLSANGAVANVKIQLLGISRQVVTFKDAYEIVSLSSSMTISESGLVKIKTGGWRITIGGAGGGIFGGTLASTLIAASPVQVVIGSFWPLVTNPPQKRNDESKAVVVAPTIPNSLASSSTGQVHQPDMAGPSHSQKRNDESQGVGVPPTKPSVLASSSTGQIQQPDMIGSSHSQKRNDESQGVGVPPTIPNVLTFSFTGQVLQPDMIGPSHSQNKNDASQAVVVPTTIPSVLTFSFTGQVQQPDMIGPSHSQNRNDESQAVVVPHIIPSVLTFSFTGQVQQPDMIGPSHSQNRNDESQAVVVPPTKPSALASSSTGQVQEPETTGSTPVLTLGWYGSEPELKK